MPEWRRGRYVVESFNFFKNKVTNTIFNVRGNETMQILSTQPWNALFLSVFNLFPTQALNRNGR